MTTSTPAPSSIAKRPIWRNTKRGNILEKPLDTSGPALNMYVMHTPHPTHPIPPLHQSYTPLQLEDSELHNPAVQSWGSQSPKALWELGDPPPSQDSPSGYTFHTR